jgi:hypothetical protein
MKACLFPLRIVGGVQTLSPTLDPSSKAFHQRKNQSASNSVALSSSMRSK